MTRRSVITGIATALSTALTGCGSTAGTDPDNSSGGDRRFESPGPNYPDEFAALKSDIESVYGALADLPIAAEGEFVFDVTAFENEFDHEDHLETVEEVRTSLEPIDADRVSGEDIRSLELAAELADLLVRQRLLTHQVIAAGVAYEHHFSEGEYDETK